MKKLLSLVLAIAMLVMSGAALAEGLTYASDGFGVFNPSYDFMETDCNSWPLVAEGENVQITVLTYMDDAYSTDPCGRSAGSSPSRPPRVRSAGPGTSRQHPAAP